MALGTEVTNRVPTSVLLALTNPESRSATSVNSTILGRAVNDVTADFKTYAGLTYDDAAATNPDHYDQHISVAVQGVVLKLRAYTQQKEHLEAYEKWANAETGPLQALRTATYGHRVAFKSNSQTTTTDESVNGAVVKPRFAHEYFSELQSQPPGGGAES